MPKIILRRLIAEASLSDDKVAKAENEIQV